MGISLYCTTKCQLELSNYIVLWILQETLKLFLLDHPFYSLNEFFIYIYVFEEDNRTNK